MDFRSIRWTSSLQTHTVVNVLIFLLLASLGTTACGGSFPVPKPDSTPTPSLPTTLPTYTPQPTLTVSPTTVIPLAVLLAPQGADSTQVEAASAALSNLSAREGIRWEIRSSLTKVDISPSLRLVIAFAPTSNLQENIQAAPNVQFLAVGISGLPDSSNLTQVSAQGAQIEQAAFMAGILAAITTDDWRVGVISLSDTPEGIAARQAFLNGVIFFCGLCRQLYPPFYKYPLYVEFASNAGQTERLSAVTALKDRYVNTVYLYPGASDAALVKALSEAGIAIIGSRSPGEFLPSQWMATIRADPAKIFDSLLPELWQGKGGKTVSMPLEIIDINPELLSPGRQGLAEKYLADILDGMIMVGANP